MERVFQRGHPAAGEILQKLSTSRVSWKDHLRETRGGLDAQLGSYAHSYMRPDFSKANADKFDGEAARRWGKTGFLGANTWQAYRDALPVEWESHPSDPIKGNDWMKLHEKNPLFLSRFMNAQGMALTSRYSGLRSGAHSQLLVSIDRARHLGLLPVWGNPYFHRNLAKKLKPRVSHVTSDQVEAYREQWIENERVKQHFKDIRKLSSEMRRLRGMKAGVERIGGLPHFPLVVDRRHTYDHRRFHHSMQHVDPLDTF
eukprot:TRINITY_DN19773_c0_g1_i1.p1 TRINITY_DN19773_c0_g1~~TRINITY_DN19773_c0_g1_i1.p1  ORF type:complete len:257 (+),score=65.45 TRINITY_DN19773_c0_g1_i1:202-972(+)